MTIRDAIDRLEVLCVLDAPSLRTAVDMAKGVLCEVDELGGLDRLRELVQADREGRCTVQKFSPGQVVWVVERDEDGNRCDVIGYVFVTSVNNVALVSPVINGSMAINDILREHVSRTAMECTGFLEAYPITDCYESKEVAKKALEDNGNG